MHLGLDIRMLGPLQLGSIEDTASVPNIGQAGVTHLLKRFEPVVLIGNAVRWLVGTELTQCVRVSQQTQPRGNHHRYQ